MGGPVQEVLQGRGDKKRQGLQLRRAVPFLLLLLSWAALQIKAPAAYPVPWFSLTLSASLALAFFHLRAKGQVYSAEFFCSICLLVAGAVQLSGLTWLKFAFFPLMILIAAFYSLSTVIAAAVFIPLLELRTLIAMEQPADRLFFSAFLIVTALPASLIFTRLRQEKEKALSSLQTLKSNALDSFRDTGMDSLSSDRIMANYFASMMKTDEEIKGLLQAIKEATVADTASFFAPQGSAIVLRCTTEQKGNITTTGKGSLTECLKDRKPFFSGDLNEKRTDIGYFRKNGKIASVFASPVMDGATPIGVLAIDSSRYQAFSEPEKKTVLAFANHLVTILERERIYPRIKRDYAGLKILNEESSKLVSTLNSEIVIEKLCEGARKIAPSRVFFFLAAGDEFELFHAPGESSADKKCFNLTGTLINMAAQNKQQIYLSDITSYRLPIMPFKTEGIRAVLVIPLIYEDNLLGLFTMLSGEKDFMDTFQTELLRVMCNQAATSLANAKLHSEIEKLATTDGLTGLYNHRTFQEKLSGELKRLSRFSGPLSLILTDIDFFKKINDTYGHPVGDLVLKATAKLIRETIRDIDIPARYGGEEFAAILPGTDSKGALKIAERLRKTIMATSFAADGTTFRVTISVGIATSPDDAKSKEELIEKTDQALYHAKHNGRNQSVIRSSMP